MEECSNSSNCAICLNSMKNKYIFIGKTKYENISKTDIYDRLSRGLSSYPIAIDKSSYNICQLQCNHKFHKKCLFKWLNKSFTCPLCRSPLSFM